ncbi:hypothetical protein M3I53_20835 [Paraburkholderia sp. CNPSo 3272]|uniref:hypothetical protein n=1 Tax=Paraburkholderia sp. CNPSo 3272 TaxID=2940931 RepID=UPI0020B6DCBE|nr:hypothetical protein [Paraburkholderia sp. CNPSo 3272]MCP3725540.1 hypothetical protein [Paraburkholderia sp. CNPSo 3272]
MPRRTTHGASGGESAARPHANAALIRAHHNATLSTLGSFGPKISAGRTGEIAFEPAA